MIDPSKPLLTTLPGDIPGLLRRRSPVLSFGAECATIHAIEGELHHCALTWDGPPIMVRRYASDLVLDLTDPTGRVHAAWWVGARIDLTVWPTEPGSDDEAVMLAQGGADMTPEQIDALARLVLRLAGRETP